MQRISQLGWAREARIQAARERVLDWLSQGLSPRRLAFTLALGFAVGCIPLLGMTTCLCAGLAFMFRLNMPAIQAANWAAMPLQVVLLLPFLRLGQWLFAAQAINFSRSQMMAQLQSAPLVAMQQMAGAFGHALLAWLITAGPAFVLLTLGSLSRIPTLAMRFAEHFSE
jgi:uncharacterized protein (DUF2062 family)